MSLNTEFLFFPLEAEVASPLLRHPNLARVLTHVRGYEKAVLDLVSIVYQHLPWTWLPTFCSWKCRVDASACLD